MGRWPCRSAEEVSVYRRSDEPFLHAILPYYARTQVVEDLIEYLMRLNVVNWMTQSLSLLCAVQEM